MHWQSILGFLKECPPLLLYHEQPRKPWLSSFRVTLREESAREKRKSEIFQAERFGCEKKVPAFQKPAVVLLLALPQSLSRWVVNRKQNSLQPGLGQLRVELQGQHNKHHTPTTGLTGSRVSTRISNWATTTSASFLLFLQPLVARCWLEAVGDFSTVVCNTW